ncbi:3-phosphoshikimate 1-carboxyvinyltransferase [bacterium]|nr:3-phosphoshikimate 1-carboxyvinyltransferase [bacterium]
MGSERTEKPTRFSTVSITAAQAPLRGRLRLPGDKSLSIRRALLTLFTDHDTTLENYGSGEDCLTALYCLKQLGKSIERSGARALIKGRFENRHAALDCRNSGTTARLLMGILSGIEGEWVLSGDESLSSRPMARVAAPLREMGAAIELTNGRLPARIRGGTLKPIRYDAPVASAQVKSAVLLAGLSGGARIEYREPFPSRAHTENLLGLKTDKDGWLRLTENAHAPSGTDLSGTVPGDPSSAAFWGVAAALIPDSELILENVLTDSSRCGWIDVLKSSGADIQADNETQVYFESVGDIICRSSRLNPIQISQALVPSVIDEIPILAVAATRAEGISRMKGLSELRVKESDRLTQIEKHLSAMNAKIESHRDELRIQGPTELRGSVIDSQQDHRIAMAFAIAGLSATGITEIHSADCAAISYTEFWEDLVKLSPGSLHKYEN